MIEAEVLSHSITEWDIPIISWRCKFPRSGTHNQFLMYRMFSRSFSSNRAIPFDKLLSKTREDPFIPKNIKANQKGMQAGEVLSEANQEAFLDDCLELLECSIEFANTWKNQVHKQWLNRYIESWAWSEVIVTATDIENFFTQRCHPAAQEEIQELANLMRSTLQQSTPKLLKVGEWHLPFIRDSEREAYDSWTLKRMSAARCARVSYTNHFGVYSVEDDLKLAKRLREDGHWGPFEHQATPDKNYYKKKEFVDLYSLYEDLQLEKILYNDNFNTWQSFRNEINNDNVGI